ncbi:MAG: CRTAC1 family protein [Terriglobia bacterium]
MRTGGRIGVILSAGCILAVLIAGKVSTSTLANIDRTSSPSVQFMDQTQTAGIRFSHFKGNNGTSTILEEAGPGVCVADFDGDGYQDIYFVNGRDLYNRGISARNALYRNNGDGTFTDVTERAGVPGTAYGLGCVWGDYDNDGFPDLYVTQYGKNILYHNNGNGTFTDVTDKAGVGATEFGTTFHTAATFFDYDRDGRLDLYAGGYANFLPSSQRYCNIGQGILSSCRPAIYQGSPDVLYHNNGNGTFSEVTRAAKIFQPNGFNLTAAAADYDNDGWPDLFVANDGTDAYLYHNNHNGTFANVATVSGMAFSEDGSAMAGMCISLGDYDNDGYLDLLITDFQMMSDHLWHNDGKGYFDEISGEAGIRGATRQVLSFGGGFFDYDNDGRLDIFIANGSVYPEIEKVSSEIHYKQINSLFHNDGKGKFSEVGKTSGDGFATPHAGRGVAFADFDNDGNMDLVVANNGDPPLLLHNSGGTGNHFLNFKLVGTRSNRDAMGARVRLRAGGISQIREIAGGGSYLSQSDLRAHFGLGHNTRADEVEVSWPSGQHQVFRNVAADKFYLIVEGKNQLQRQAFSRPLAAGNH